MGQELVTLFDGYSEAFVHNMQGVLRNKGISSVHLSSGYQKFPKPTGLRVKNEDYARARILLNEYKASMPKKKKREFTKEEKEMALAGRIVFGLIAAGIITVFIWSNMQGAEAPENNFTALE